MNKSRFGAIDFLRGIAIVVMIALHTQAYFLNDKRIYTVWDYSNFVVQIFLFVSAYIFFKKEKVGLSRESLGYIKKRLWRLILPYYVFLVGYFALIFFFEPKTITPTLILQNFLLVGGADINWLVILFLYMAALMPVLYFLKLKNRLLINAVFLISLISSCILLFYKLPISYKLTMWLPWLMIIGVTYYYEEFEGTKRIALYLTIGGLAVYAAGYMLLSSLHKSLVLFDNKYPPNIYFLSYGVAWLGLLLMIYEVIKNQKIIMAIFNYFSRYSYSLFFLHYLAIYAFTKSFHYQKFGWFGFFIIIMIISIASQTILTTLTNLFKKSH